MRPHAWVPAERDGVNPRFRHLERLPRVLGNQKGQLRARLDRQLIVDVVLAVDVVPLVPPPPTIATAAPTAPRAPIPDRHKVGDRGLRGRPSASPRHPQPPPQARCNTNRIVGQSMIIASQRPAALLGKGRKTSTNAPEANKGYDRAHLGRSHSASKLRPPMAAICTTCKIT